MAPDIPSQFKFEDLLHHTFPGLFSAITLFMLIDIWSPFDLTSFVIKDVNSLVAFIGFVIIVGTILGIMIDGIHHLTQGLIFNNFGEIKDLNRFIEFLYSKKERDIKIGITRHYFFKILGNDKATAIDEYLFNSTQVYSEFYANTFIALIPFSLVVPFYLFYVLQIPWSLSIITALLSLSLACTCLKSSYSVYKKYLEAIYSVMRGYLKVKYDPPEVKGISETYHSWGIIINILVLIIDYFIATKIFELNWMMGVLISLLGLLFIYFIYSIWKIQDYQKQDYFSPGTKDESRSKVSKIIAILSKNAFGLTLTFLFMLFIILFVQLFLYAPAFMVTEPKTLAEDITMGNQSTKTISIKNIGSDITDLKFNITLANKNWISLSSETIPIVKSGETNFIQVNLTIPQNETSGDYQGAITINAKANGKDVTHSIPVVIQVKP